jgi:hypothetical protein
MRLPSSSHTHNQSHWQIGSLEDVPLGFVFSILVLIATILEGLMLCFLGLLYQQDSVYSALLIMASLNVAEGELIGFILQTLAFGNSAG